MFRATTKYRTITFPRPTPADWIMIAKDSEVHFNAHVLDRCSLEFFRLIILHECFHLFVQGLPNKLDAKRLKDDFGEGFMKLLDIEADYYAAMYFKEVEHASLIDVFELYHQGSAIFGDPDIRLPKLERFMGSVLSIANAYFKSPGARQPRANQLYLPAISNILTAKQMHVLVLKNHFAVEELQVNHYDFDNLMQCYTGSDGRGIRDYVETLVQFASKALGAEIPPAILNELYRRPAVSIVGGGTNMA